MIPSSIKSKIESYLRSNITSTKALGGGCISDSSIIKTSAGESFFLKVNNDVPPDMFTKEANGLKEIENSKSIRVPKVILASHNFILLEFVETGSKSRNFFIDFGISFAEMHKFTSQSFGFFENNYIGSTLQNNVPSVDEKNDWTKYYFNKRLLFQFKLAEKNGYTDTTFRNAFSKIENKIEQILLTDEILPSLLHGDLWAGNYLVDHEGKACLIDPAVYYGHREADLAMTKLFGGFSPEFYAAYNDAFPLSIGYEYRENIYKLYHVLNHLNLFGTGYFQQALSLMMYYL